MSSPIMGTDWSSRVSGRRWLVAGVLAILVVLLAVGWLLLVVLQGRETRSQDARSIGEFLTRSAGDMGLPMGEVTVLYATPTYFQITGKAREAAQYSPEQYLVFFISEDLHHWVELPLFPPQARLRVDRGQEYRSVEGTQVLAIESDLHRTSVVRFPMTDAQGRNIIAGAVSLELVLSVTEPTRTTATVRWDLPIEYIKRVQPEAIQP